MNLWDEQKLSDINMAVNGLVGDKAKIVVLQQHYNISTTFPLAKPQQASIAIQVITAKHADTALQKSILPRNPMLSHGCLLERTLELLHHISNRQIAFSTCFGWKIIQI